MIVELEKLTIKCLLERTFEKYGSRRRSPSSRTSPSSDLQLKQQIQETATALVARNIPEGDRVAIMGETAPTGSSPTSPSPPWAPSPCRS